MNESLYPDEDPADLGYVTSCECCLEPAEPSELVPCSACAARVHQRCLSHRICLDCLSADEEQ